MKHGFFVVVGKGKKKHRWNARSVVWAEDYALCGKGPASPLSNYATLPYPECKRCAAIWAQEMEGKP